MSTQRQEFSQPAQEVPVREPSIERGVEIPSPASLETTQDLHLQPMVIPPTDSQTGPAVSVVSPLHRDIERILEEDLIPLYKELSPEQKVQFKTEGERAVSQIEMIIKQAVVRVRDIVRILMKWLSLLPGVNRFYIEQEAKLKADKLLFLKKTSLEP